MSHSVVCLDQCILQEETRNNRGEQSCTWGKNKFRVVWLQQLRSPRTRAHKIITGKDQYYQTIAVCDDQHPDQHRLTNIVECGKMRNLQLSFK